MCSTLIESRHRLKLNLSLFIDGTHSFIAKSNTLITVSCLVRGNAMVLAAFITKLKTTQAYTDIFAELRDVTGNSTIVNNIVLDAELALWSSLSDVYPTARLHLCKFHFLDAIRRRLTQHHHTVDTKKRELIMQCCRNMFVAAHRDVFIDEWTKLQSGIGTPREFIKYFKHQWIGTLPEMESIHRWARHTFVSSDPSLDTNNVSEAIFTT